MAFGKKKDDAPAATDIDDAASEEEEASPGDDDALDAAFAPGDEAVEEAPAEAAEAAPAAGADALLSMFADSKEEVDDLGVLVDLAGDADLDDILEELRTLRAALGITDAYEDEGDFAAAA